MRINSADATAVDCNTLIDGDYVKCKLTEVMESYFQEIVCQQKLKDREEKDTSYPLCTDTQDETAGNPIPYDKGAFGDASLNQRNQEALLTLAFLYDNPLSSYSSSTVYGYNLLYRVLWGLDFLCRAQGSNGAISETGWKGPDFNSEGLSEGSATSAAGFTYYAAARAILILSEDADFHAALADDIILDEDGSSDDVRGEAYQDLLSNAANFLTSTDNGRGNAPNQAIYSLLALYAINEAYDAISNIVDGEGDYSLVSESDLSSLRSEVQGGEVLEIDSSTGDANGFDRWLSDQGMILEKGYRPSTTSEEDTIALGYDSSYGIVSLRGLVLLSYFDSTNFPIDSGTTQDYIEGMRVFFYLDPHLHQGGFHVSALSRRSENQNDYEMPFTAAGLGQDNQTLQTLFNASLENFVANPTNFFEVSNVLGNKLSSMGELINNWQEPTESSYTLPLNDEDLLASRVGDIIYQDTSDNSTYYANYQVYNSDGTLEGIRYDATNWWDGTKHYYFGAETAKIEGASSTEIGCYDSSKTAFSLDSVISTCSDTYDDGGRRESGTSDDSLTRIACHNEKGKLKETFVCKIAPSGDYIVETPRTCVVDGNSINASGCDGVSYSVDADGDGIGDYFDDSDGDGTTDFFDDDDDNDDLSDTDETTDGTDPYDSDSDDDGLTDGSEVSRGTDPLDTDSDDDSLSDGEEVDLGTDPNNTDTDGDGISDGSDSDPLRALDLTPILSLLFSGDEDGDGQESIDDGGEDCDDEDATIYSGAEETCGDGIDQDCDGSDLACVTDTDGDGVDDDVDLCPSSTPIDASDTIDASGCALSQLDTDGDRLTDYDELITYGTDPNNRDTDGDRLSDFIEVNFYNTDPTNRDSDGDRLSDSQEVRRYGTDPNDADTDDDGMPDGLEVRFGRDPLNPAGQGICGDVFKNQIGNVMKKITVLAFILSLLFAQKAFAYTYLESGGVEGG